MGKALGNRDNGGIIMEKNNRVELERNIKQYLKELERNILCDIAAICDLEEEK
jgi:hypothetical protein